VWADGLSIATLVLNSVACFLRVFAIAQFAFLLSLFILTAGLKYASIIGLAVAENQNNGFATSSKFYFQEFLSAITLTQPGLSIAKNTVFTYNTRPIHPPLVYARLSKHTFIALSLHKSGLTHHKSYGTK